MLGWFQALMPKEERFFTLFEKHAKIVVAGAEALRGLLQGGDGVESYCKQVFQREAEADDVTKEVLLAVRRTFITPFDRTDIQDLISSMDDAIDQMNKTAKAIVLFEVNTFEPPMRDMGEIIVQSAKLVLEAVPLLNSIGSNAAQLNALTTKIVQIEDHADNICDRGIKELFLASRAEGNQGNAMKFVIGSELYDHLEKVVDRFEDVANEINSIVVDQL
jgi:predicted phosphate transport protein (TIGR00153 family)